MTAEEMNFNQPFIDGGKFVGEDGERRSEISKNVIEATVGIESALPETIRAEVKGMTLEQKLDRARNWINTNLTPQEATALLKTSKSLEFVPLDSPPGVEELRALVEERAKSESPQ